ncbi:hypothetical protein GDO81_024648 [Engystomops pustulosus]|uniref:Uncharacterized protein n=1 Tax=Engystomops pustulosus TaxID=76066 RepID=A0AAV6ZGZ7_ENGPU|nr:hypothetical protein GDO81_024648 [Engystomops pustulosus]
MASSCSPSWEPMTRTWRGWRERPASVTGRPPSASKNTTTAFPERTAIITLGGIVMGLSHRANAEVTSGRKFHTTKG